jgi:Wall-associated receptor kinase C-terminal/Wall-associated receptor kinase galacturonan-binding
VKSPEHCGVPGFLISCENETPILHLKSENYTVLDIDYHNHTITLVDTDVLEQESCPKVQNNVSLFIDSGVTYTSSDVSLIFFFGCDLSNDSGNHSPITCLTSDESSYVFLLNESALYTDFMTSCQLVVVAPVLQPNLELNYLDLNAAFGKVLKQGFQLGWNPTNNCTECLKIKGQCGYTLSNDTTYNFNCFCPHNSCGMFHLYL